MRTSSGLLHMLGARPLLGRVLLPEEDKPGKPAVAILSYRLWKRLVQLRCQSHRPRYHA